MKKKLVQNLAKASYQNIKLRSIPNPTMAESFGEKFNQDLAQQYLNPRGVMYESEAKKAEQTDNNKHQKQKLEHKKKNMPEEHGFKYEGAEPTRHGDWEHKGRCTDFE